MITAWLAFLLDCIIGDPKSTYHPVALIGKLIATLEKALLVKAQRPAKQIFSGAVLVAVVLSFIYASALLIVGCAAAFGAAAELFVSAVILCFAVSPRSLAQAGQEIEACLIDGDLRQARIKVGWIVGRDTERLDAPEVTRATVETIAENIVDGIISPFFYFFIGGAPLAFLYRAVNTLDSMIAYKNDKYLYFGRTAAYIDDICNYVPARFTAGLLILAAALLRFNYRGACRMVKRDAAKHPSPNGGYPESAVAGALDIQLGGLNYYFGVPSMRALMGDPTNVLAPVHIKKTILLMYAATILFLLLATCITVMKGGGSL